MPAKQKWVIAPSPDPKLIREFADALDLAPVVVSLALQRGFSDKEELERFLYPRLKDLGDPFSLPQVDKAVARILTAVDEKQSVVLYGDYDVDGVSSIAVLINVLRAYGLDRARAENLGIDQEDFGKYDVHVHVPAGAVPKDGPSAGCAMYTALASLFSDKRVDKDIAMTGEINLRGSVLPIGGLKEKALGAVQAGIKTILVPALNMKDVPDIPESARKRLKILPMATVDDVLEAVLLKS